MTLTDVLGPCKKYGYTATEMGGDVYIQTQFEHWKFESNPSPRAKVKLMHRGFNAEDYHRQFHQAISASDLILYVHQHEIARFTTQWVDFKFTKDGVLRSSTSKKGGKKNGCSNKRTRRYT